jgi:hypothetical protein
MDGVGRMKPQLLCLCLLVAIGCGRDGGGVTTAVYPALDESPEPPPAGDGVPLPSPTVTQDAPATVADDGWLPRQVQKEEQIRSLRENAAKARKDDPFALTQEEIDAFAKRDDAVIF